MKLADVWLLIRRPTLAVFVICAVAAVTMVGAITMLQNRGNTAWEETSSLQRIGSETNKLSRLEWQAIAEGELSPELIDSLAATRMAAAAGIADISGDGGEAELTLLYAAYDQALTRELAAIGAGDFAVAKQIDEDEVDPAFDRLQEAIEGEAAEHAEKAAATGRLMNTATALIIIGASLGAWLLIIFHERSVRSLNGTLEKKVKSRTGELHSANAKLEYLAYHDSLTALPNRSLLEDRLVQALAQAQRKGQMLALIFIDLDAFKVVNDTLGHSVGDQLLRAAADRLKALVREGDTVARIGGDEFVLLLNDVGDVDNAVEIARRVGRNLKEPYRIAEQELTVTVSCGISIFPTDGEDATSLLRNADTAMYRAKEQGQDDFQLYTPGMGVEVRRRLALENELRRAIAEDQLVLHYQPIVDINTGKIASCEALVRWQHPEHGLMPPMEFIGLAEKAGLMIALTEWVMRAACLQHKAWEGAGLRIVPIAINISAHRFQYSGFGDMTRRLLLETSLDPRQLRLEITEGVLMEDTDRAAVVLKSLRDQGIRISIDDFGTGYSSLSYLRHLPIDNLKIDRSFVAGISDNPEDQAIVQAIMALAQSLHLNVIAEGVETDGQLQFLRREGCQQVQGFLFARPMPGADFAKLLGADKALVPGGPPSTLVAT